MEPARLFAERDEAGTERAVVRRLCKGQAERSYFTLSSA